MINKIFTYSGVAIVSLAVIAMFVTATTPIQLGAAIIVYPVLVLIIFKIFVAKDNNQVQTVSTSGFQFAPVNTVPAQTLPSLPVQPIQSAERSGVELVDIDKRAFLKLVGGVGLSFFIFSLFNKRVGNLLLNGNDTTPQNSLFEEKPMFPNGDETNGYKISEIMSDSEFTYYGFVNQNGNWLIMREDTATGSFRYAKGNSNFNISWQDREHLTYGYYHDTFKN